MREYELEILNQYDIEIISTRKVRGAFFCETNEGLMLLKEAGISDGRALLLYQLLRQLSGSGYEKCGSSDIYKRTGADQYVEGRNTLYAETLVRRSGM